MDPVVQNLLTSKLRLLIPSAKNVYSKYLDTNDPAVFEDLLKNVEDAIADIGLIEPTQCRRGCNFCCHRPIRATAPEIHLAAKAVKASPKRDEIVANLEKYELKPGQTCPMLINGECAVYQSRPIICRTKNSKSAAACERFLSGEIHEHEVPSSHGQTGLYERLVLGFHGAALNKKTTVPYYLLATAVKELLEKDELTSDSQFREVPTEWTQWAPYERYLDPKVEGFLRSAQTRLESEGQQIFSGLKEVSPTSFLVHSLRSHHYYGSWDEVDSERERVARVMEEIESKGFEDPYEAISEFSRDVISFGWSYQGRKDKAMRQRYGRMIHDQMLKPVCPELLEPMPPRKPGPPRVGYLSPRFRESSATRWALRWLKAQQGTEIETTVVDIGFFQDAFTRDWKQGSSKFLRYEGSIIEAARKVRELDLDVLIFPDVGVDSVTEVVGSMRLARSQACAWGCPTTSGLVNMDFFLAGEHFVTDVVEADLSEKWVKLPGIGFEFPKHLIVQPFGRPFQAPANPFVFCVQDSAKLHFRWDGLYRALQDRLKVPLVLSRGSNQPLVDKLTQRLKQNGLTFGFLPFLNESEFSSALQKMAFSLDTPYYNGGITALHALWMQCPILTLPGERLRDRFGAAFMTHVGLGHWVPKDEAEYLNFAENWLDMRAEAERTDMRVLGEDSRVAPALNDWIRERAAQS